MNNAHAKKFRILVVGDVISNNRPGGVRRTRRLTSPARAGDMPFFGGAANIARIASGMGNTVGFLLLGQTGAEARLHQITHFHDLLARYQVIVFSEHGHCAPSETNAMIGAARLAGRRVLVDLDGNGVGIPTGASLMICNAATLRRLIGTWRSENELVVKMDMLLSGFHCEGFLVNLHEAGTVLYLPGGAVHFTNMIRCDRHYLLAAVAAELKAGISLAKGLCAASDRFDPEAAESGLDSSFPEMALS
jgi:bifunctional ADP-heptose synthase (sugar kinase/adenylyltransferase)